MATNAACLPDPSGDYDDFVKRTANITATTATAPASDAAPFDSRPPDVAVEALYVGICVTVITGGDPNLALRFYTTSKYTPDSSGASNGKIDVTLTPMLGYDTAAKQPTKPASVSKSETRGDTITIPEATVAPSGRFTANVGTVNLVAAANSISGRDLTIEQVVLEGLFGSGDRFCTSLAGQLTKPYQLTFEPAQNTCIFQKVKEGDPLPTIPASDFVCKL
jgi:hypothetical protein